MEKYHSIKQKKEQLSLQMSHLNQISFDSIVKDFNSSWNQLLNSSLIAKNEFHKISDEISKKIETIHQQQKDKEWVLEYIQQNS